MRIYGGKKARTNRSNQNLRMSFSKLSITTAKICP
jgi:hypothetical protein